MSNKDFDYLFDENVKKNIKNSFEDINFSDELNRKIKNEVLRNRTFKENINDFLNYEIEIPVGRIGVIAAILAIIPITFTFYEGKKIMSNNIRYQQNNITYNDIDK